MWEEELHLVASDVVAWLLRFSPWNTLHQICLDSGSASESNMHKSPPLLICKQIPSPQSSLKSDSPHLTSVNSLSREI